ncbi:MAG TPA: Mur ligase domain-containing protein [Candidatus Dormibacteraeota bacterium]|nr:Mur ligase domain-containing protein [Candidatus Dormibacteraeota bacterium]
MHVFFSGIGGTAIGPLALIAKQAGFEVSGSDKQNSQYIEYLRAHGIDNIHLDQSRRAIAAQHEAQPIDWFVYTSALTLENPDAPELLYCTEQGIKTSKRDEFLSHLLQTKGMKLLAIAGTHGKTTTTAMVIWLFQQIGLPISYSVGAKIPFGEMGHFESSAEYFIYEADEFDRNFLAFEPHLSIISGVSWDHHEIFPTREDYQAAFREFISQSQQTFVWQEDADYLGLTSNPTITILNSDQTEIKELHLAGLYNRLDAWAAVSAVRAIAKTELRQLIDHINRFPGLSRRMEKIAPGLYSDYAHTPEKIRGGMSVATEMAAETGQKVIVIYEPLTNRRQHYMLNDYRDCFSGATKVYWTNSYLAREDPSQRIIPPEELISHLADPSVAVSAKLDAELKSRIEEHLAAGDMVVAMAGGGGGSLDDWLRKEFGT